MSCLVPCRTWHWPPAQVLSHLPHLPSSRSLPHTQVLWCTIHVYSAMIHGGVADPPRSHLPQKVDATLMFFPRFFVSSLYESSHVTPLHHKHGLQLQASSSVSLAALRPARIQLLVHCLQTQWCALKSPIAFRAQLSIDRSFSFNLFADVVSSLGLHVLTPCHDLLNERTPEDLAIWYMEYIQITGKRFGNQFSTFDPSRNHPQGIHHCMTPRETGSVPQATGTGTSFERDDDDHEFINTGGNSAELNGWTAETPNIGTAIRQIPYCTIIFMLEEKTQKSSDHLFCFSIRIFVMDQRSGDRRFIGELKSSQSNNWEEFSKIWNVVTEQDTSEFPLQEEGQSRGTESPERGPVLTRKTDRLHDLRLLSSKWRSWYRIGSRRFILCYSSRR